MGGVFDFNTYTFFGCASLASVKIPNSVTNIDKYTFSGCSQLTKVIVPDSVTTMGLGVFNDYTSIEEITLPFLGKNKDDTIYSYIGYAFGASSSDYSQHTSKVPESLSSVTINYATFIKQQAFNGCENITTIVLPEGVERIGHNAFTSCTSLTNINTPESVTSIGIDAFYDCKKLFNYSLTVETTLEIG